MAQVSRHIRATAGLVGLLALFPAGTPGQSPGAARGPRIDRALGEEEQIRLRREWFYESRRAGAATDREMSALRLQGVRATRAAIDLQRQARRAARGGPAQNLWVEMGPSPSTFGGWSFGSVSGRVSSIAADWAGGVLYVATASGGLWKSTDDGLSWTSLFDGAGTMTVGTVTVDPNDADVLWVGTGENVAGCETYFGIGLLRSADGGLTWEARNGTGAQTLDELASFANVIVDPRDSDRIVTGGRTRQCSDGSGLAGGLYTTDDGGSTWTPRLTNVRIYEIAQDPTVQDTWWAASENGVYRSLDNAESWTLMTASGLPAGSTGRTELAIAPGDSNKVYALFSSPTALWRTTDGGVSWTQMSTGSDACDGQCGYNMVLRVDPFDADTVYRGTILVYRSNNGGASWSNLTNGWGSSQKVHQDTHHLLMDPTTPGAFYVGSDGGVWKSSDSGASFQNRNGNLNVTQFYAVGVRAGDPGVICGGAQDNSSLVRTGSNIWDLQAVTGDGFVCQFDPVEEQYGYITSYPSGGYPNVWRTSSAPFGGFTDVTGSGSGIVGGDRINWVTPYALDPQDPSTLYLGTHRVYRSDDRGSSWTQVGPADLTGNSGSLRVVEINRSFPDVVFSGSQSGRVWRTVDGGTGWTDLSAGLPSRSINDIAADPTNPDRAFAVVGGFNSAHVWEWTLAGGWTARDVGVPNVPANTVLMLSDTEIFVGTDVGILRSGDGGATFAPFMAGLPEGLVVTDLRYNLLQNVLTAGTYGRGAWQLTLGPAVPILLFDRIELPPIEVDGDGDAHVEPGETWAINARLRNGGGATAGDARARLTTATPGVTVIESAEASYGDIPPGSTAGATTAFEFVVSPAFTCGDSISFDLVDVTSTDPPIDHGDSPGVFVVDVVDDRLPGDTVPIASDDFDPAPGSDWSHQSIDAGVAPCGSLPYSDEWQVLSKDAAHGNSYHCGGGPGASHGVRDLSWLYYGGKDSDGGPGIDIPADAQDARLRVEHWYDTEPLTDGAQVVVDAQINGVDDFVTLVPDGGYPTGVLGANACNGLEGLPAFHGSSGGWVESTFDLMPYRGRKIHLAFVFASGFRSSDAEGWYIDDITVEIQAPGDPVCQVSSWPGTVPATLRLDLVDATTLSASWEATCNAGTVAGQTESIQSGDLGVLRATGAYDYVPVEGSCDRSSPATIPAGDGSRYFLVVPVADGRQGTGGRDSAGALRTSADATCGLVREDTCD